MRETYNTDKTDGKLSCPGGEYMYQKKIALDIRCPLEYGLEIFGGKWKPRIICVLNEKKVR